MTHPTEYTSASARLRAGPRPNPTSTGRRLKRNVLVTGRRTTIVLEAYVWDCIDSMLEREGSRSTNSASASIRFATSPAWRQRLDWWC